MNDFLQGPNNGQKNKRGTKTRRVFDSNHSYNAASKFHSGKYQGVRNGNMQRTGRQNFQAGLADKASAFSAETVETIVSLVRTLTTSQELLVDIQERRVVAEERKADALENIAESLNILSAQIQAEDDEMIMEEPFQEGESEFAHEPFQGVAGGFYPEREPESAVEHAKMQDFVNSGGKFQKSVGTRKRKEISRNNQNRKKIEKTAGSQHVDSGSGDILSREEAMATIYRMREQGATFNQIANYFIERNQPTFSGKGKWHAQTIHRLLQKHKQSEAA